MKSIFEKDVEKVYAVEFMEYNDALKESVGHNYEEMTYIEIPYSPFLVRESDLEFYRNYGCGFREIHFVGCLPKIDTTEIEKEK